MKKILTGTLLMLALGFSTTSSADNPIKLLLHAAYDFGGETIGEVYYDDYSVTEIRANQGLEIGAGVSIPVAPELEFQSILGYQTMVESDYSGEMQWSTTTWENLMVARMGQLSLGGGVVYYMNPQLETEGSLTPLGEQTFDDALGFRAQVGYTPRFTGDDINLEMGLRYSAVEFDLEEYAVKGNGSGLYMRYLF